MMRYSVILTPFRGTVTPFSICNNNAISGKEREGSERRGEGSGRGGRWDEREGSRGRGREVGGREVAGEGGKREERKGSGSDGEMEREATDLLAYEPARRPVAVDQAPRPVDEHWVPRVLALLVHKLHARLVLSALRVSGDRLAVQPGVPVTGTSFKSSWSDIMGWCHYGVVTIRGGDTTRQRQYRVVTLLGGDTMDRRHYGVVTLRGGDTMGWWHYGVVTLWGGDTTGR